MRDFLKDFDPRTLNVSQPETGTSRRGFIKLMTGAGAGLTLGIHLPAMAAGEKETSGVPFEPNAFIRVNADNTVTIMIKHLDMGQGVTTGLATIAADELDAEWSLVTTQAAPANANLYNNLLFGTVQGTGGSTTIANSFMQMRIAGAKAKAMLVGAAAKIWQVPVDEIVASNSTLSHQSGKSATYGEVAEIAALQPVPSDEQVVLKTPEQFTLIGKTGTTRKDKGKSNGTATFTIDVQLEGMLTALVAHPPAFGAKVKSFDATAAKQSPGVVNVVQIPTGVAVIAKDFWSAKTARDKLEIEWDRSAFNKSTETLKQEYTALTEKPGLPARNDGDAPAVLKNAEGVIEATYYFI